LKPERHISTISTTRYYSTNRILVWYGILLFVIVVRSNDSRTSHSYNVVNSLRFEDSWLPQLRSRCNYRQGYDFGLFDDYQRHFLVQLKVYGPCMMDVSLRSWLPPRNVSLCQDLDPDLIIQPKDRPNITTEYENNLFTNVNGIVVNPLPNETNCTIDRIITNVLTLNIPSLYVIILPMERFHDKYLNLMDFVYSPYGNADLYNCTVP
jgi:hypothetical protein